MMILHINMPFQAVIGKLNHHCFGWVEDAQGFVFISGFDACWKAVLLRIRTIYSHQAGLTLIFLVIDFLAAGLGYTTRPQTYLSPFLEHPLEVTLSSLLLVSGMLIMGIVPMRIPCRSGSCSSRPSSCGCCTRATARW